MLKSSPRNYGAAALDRDVPADWSTRVSGSPAANGPTERAKASRQMSRQQSRSCREWLLLICCWPCLLGFCCLHCCESLCGCTCDDEDCSCVRNGNVGTDGDEVDERTPLPVDTHETSLTLACCRGKATADDIDRLVQRGENVNQRNSRGDAPLIIAASRERVDLVRALLTAGADPNARDVQGYTVLMRAAECGSVDVTNALLDAGADPTVRLADGTSALYVAGSAQQWRVVDTLLAASATQQQFAFLDSVLRSTLKKARRVGLEPLCLKIVETGLPLNGQDRYGYTPLMIASREGLDAVVEAMLSRGASVSAQARFEGETSLSLACGHSYHFRRHYSRTIRLLLEAGANVDQPTGSIGITPLGYAVHAGNDEIVDTLLEYGADPNHTDKAGLTPLQRIFWPLSDLSLHTAVRAKLTISLLRGGAHVDHRGRVGKTALQLIAANATSLHMPGLLADILLRAGASPRSASHSSKSAVELAAQSAVGNLPELMANFFPSLFLLSSNAVRVQLRPPTRKSAACLPLDASLKKAVCDSFHDSEDVWQQLKAAQQAADEAKDDLVEVYRGQLEAQHATENSSASQ